MRNLKRVLSLALALVMVLGMMVIGTSAATFAEEEIENVEAVEVMNALGIIKGDGDKFYPDRVLTREEAAKILAYVVLGPDVEDYLTGSESPFTDVKSERWSAKYIAFCKNAKYIHGETETTFNPKGQLTVIGFGKLLLGALGYDTTKYTGSDWANTVKTDMKAAGLDVVEFDTKTLIDRDTACLMALEAMKQPVGESKGWYYNDTTWKTKLGYFPTFIEAFNAAKSVLGDAVDVAKVMEDTTSNTLLAKNYQVTYDNTDVYDKFGRPAVSYTQAVENDDDIVTLYVDEPVFATNKPMTAKELAAALKGYKVAVGATTVALDAAIEKTAQIKTPVVWNNFDFAAGYGVNFTVENMVDGEYEYDETTGKTTMADFLAYNMNDFTSWEIYAGANKVITRVVGVETVAAVIVNAEEMVPAEGETPAIPAYIELSITDGAILRLNNFVTDKFTEEDEGDTVLCTVAYDYDSADGTYNVITVEKAETVTGKVTGFTKDGVFTIGEKTYEVSEIAGVATTIEAVKEVLEEEKKFVLDANGNIVAFGAPDGAPAVADPVITDYVYVKDTYALVEIEEEESVWDDTVTRTYEFTMQVKVLLDDGTEEIWDVPVLQAAANTRVGTTNVLKGQFYYQLASKNATVVTLATVEDDVVTYLTAEQITGALASALEATEGKVYTYADKALVAEVAGEPTGDAAKKPAVMVDSLSGMSATEYVVGGVILNDKTVFILKDTNVQTGVESIVIKTGLAALESTGAFAGKVIATYTPVLNEEGNVAASTIVATLVFAQEVEFEANAPEDAEPDDFVFVDDDYAVAKVGTKTYHTYNVVYTDGTAGTITIEVGSSYSELETGIYVLMDDGTIGDLETAATAVLTVKVVSGTTVIFTDANEDMAVGATTSKTVVVGGELKVGAKALVVAGENSTIALAYIVG